jgi:predicted nuclease with RNAse H fold
MPARGRVVVGLDLAGSPRRTTGFCRLGANLSVELAPLHSDAEILERTRSARPALVSVDAPLSIPRGRRTIDDRSGPHLRACDRALLERRIRFFPVTLGPMRMLTARGLALQALLTSEGFRVIESYPGGAQDVLGIPRKQAGIEPLREGLRALGVTGEIDRPDVTHDELDAITSALVGRWLLEGRAEALGDPSEGLLYLPKAIVRR